MLKFDDYEEVEEVGGRPLPFRTYEDDPRRAVLRFLPVVKHWVKRIAQRDCNLTPGRHIEQLACVGLKFAATDFGKGNPGDLFVDYSTLARLGASLWQLRHAPGSFDTSVRDVLRDKKGFMHHEFVLFQASLLRTSGLPVEAIPKADVGQSLPDLLLADATAGGKPIYWEVKERDPGADRGASSILAFVENRVRDAVRQFKRRDASACGFAVIDLGVMKTSTLQGYEAVLRRMLNKYDRLYGVTLSATVPTKVRHGDDYFLCPRFWSHTIDTSLVYEGRARLRQSVIRGLRRRFDPNWVEPQT